MRSPVPPGSGSPQRLLNWMLALACQRGHLGLVKLLVLTHGADPESCAVRKNEFPVIVRLPLYAAIKSGGWPSAPPLSPARRRDPGHPVLCSCFRNVCMSPRPSPHPARGIHRPWQVGGAPQGRAPRGSRRSRGKSRGRPAGTSSSQLTCRQPRHGPALRCPPLSLVRALGNEDIAIFLLRHGAFFCSYILLDSPDPSKHLLRKYFIEASALPSGCSGKMVSGHRPRIRG